MAVLPAAWKVRAALPESRAPWLMNEAGSPGPGPGVTIEGLAVVATNVVTVGAAVTAEDSDAVAVTAASVEAEPGDVA
jgi:hypothetical protein